LVSDIKGGTPRRDELTQGRRKLHNEENQLLLFAKIRTIKPSGKKRDAYRLLVGKPGGKRQLEWP
jgi:hypothetical protein